MFGLAVLFGLGVWIGLTILAMFIGGKIGARFFSTLGGWIGAFLGFMLLMGGFFVYWLGEFIFVQYQLRDLCKHEAYSTVYMTPAQWRKEIGEEEWKRSTFIGSSLPSRLKTDLEKNKLNIDGKVYNRVIVINQRLDYYEIKNKKKYKYLDWSEGLYYDNKLKKIVYRYKYFRVKDFIMSSSNLDVRFWLNYGMQECRQEIVLVYEYTPKR